MDRRLAAQEKHIDAILAIVQRLDRDHIVEEAARSAREQVRKERRERYGDVARVVGFLGAVVALALGVMALVGAG